MARQEGIVVTNDLSRGLITEATVLNQPVNAATEIWDISIGANKKLTRRKGWEYELAHATKAINRTAGVVNSFLWENASGDGAISMVVLQVGGTLYFYEAVDPISENASTFTIDLTTFSPVGADSPASVECQFVTGNGLLFVTHPFLNTFYLTFVTTSNITTTNIIPNIRDLDGVVSLGQDDATVLGVTVRETAGIGDLNVQHKYNLFNQGWYFNGNAALTAWDAARTDMPANSDVWWAFADTAGDWANAQVARIHLGNTPAPKGHFLINVYNEDRDSVSGLSGIPDVTVNPNRCTTAAFFAGRLWLSGINHSLKSSHVFFSQVVLAPEQYGFFYSKNDPTIELTPDLIASDGGIIKIPDAGTIYKLLAIQQGLMVFAQHGVWAITGSSGVGFAANDFAVIKISDIATTTAKTFVMAEGLPFWWNDDGIFAMTKVDSGTGFLVSDITDDSIKTFMNNIPLSSRKHAKGAYDPLSKRVHWIFQSESKGGVQELQEFDCVLTLDLRAGAFIPWTISSGDLKVHDLIVSSAPTNVITVDNVVTDDSYSSVVTTDFASDNKIDWSSHGLIDGEIVRFTTTTTLPAGLSLLTDYFLVNKTTNDFEVSLTSGGSTVVITDNGTGTHTATQQDGPIIEDSSGDTVIADVISGSTAPAPGFKYIISSFDSGTNWDFSFGETRDTSYLDWTTKEVTGVDYSSYIITGYDISGEVMRKQQTPWVSTFMDQETGAGLTLEARWDYTSNTVSGKITSAQQCFKNNRSKFDVNIARLKLRGTGRSLQLKFASESGKPFTFLGFGQRQSVSGEV